MRALGVKVCIFPFCISIWMLSAQLQVRSHGQQPVWCILLRSALERCHLSAPSFIHNWSPLPSMRFFLKFNFWRKTFASAPYSRSQISSFQIRMMSSASASALLYAASISVPTTPGTRPDDELTQSKAWHTDNGRFENPWPSWNNQSAWKIMSGLIKRRFTGKANKPDTTPPTVPIREPTFLPDRERSDKIRATWLGHACYYVEFPSGLRVLFDPVFEDRCSPFSWLGPKRYTPMPCQIADIPIIDAVIISHNHYDHLSHPTVSEIAKRHPNVHFFVPLGNKKWFVDSDIHRVTELDWWDEVDFTLTAQSPSAPTQKPSVTTPASSSAPPPPRSSQTITSRISCLPCQHTSNRGVTDRAKTLWSSWAVTTGEKSVFFGGDTGYRAVPESSDGKDDWSEEYADLPTCPVFKDVGRLRGPFDLGLIPIGAYMPRWIMSPMHANPRDAVEIFRDTGCKRALGIHWGTWVLTEEDVLEPPRLLKAALAHHGLPETGVFDVCDIGESREF